MAEEREKLKQPLEKPVWSLAQIIHMQKRPDNGPTVTALLKRLAAITVQWYKLKEQERGILYALEVIGINPDEAKAELRKERVEEAKRKHKIKDTLVKDK